MERISVTPACFILAIVIAACGTPAAVAFSQCVGTTCAGTFSNEVNDQPCYYQKKGDEGSERLIYVRRWDGSRQQLVYVFSGCYNRAAYGEDAYFWVFGAGVSDCDYSRPPCDGAGISWYGSSGYSPEYCDTIVHVAVRPLALSQSFGCPIGPPPVLLPPLP